MRVPITRFHVAPMLLAAILCTRAAQGGINAPSLLQVNLGPVLIDMYESTNSGFIPTCPSFWTVRQCYQNAFAGYRAQGVTGVRFMFAFCGGSYSTPLLNCGNPAAIQFNNVRLNRLKLFLGDVKAVGISNITPTPVFFGHGGDQGVRVVHGNIQDQCGTYPEARTFEYRPATPFPVVRSENAGPDDWGGAWYHPFSEQVQD